MDPHSSSVERRNTHRASLWTFGAIVLCVVSVSGQRPLPELVDALSSSDELVWRAALLEVRSRPTTAVLPAIPAIIHLLEREGVEESWLYCDHLERFGAAAAPALPLLVKHFDEIEGRSVPLQGCVEKIAASVGPGFVREIMRITSAHARRVAKASTWRGEQLDLELFDSMFFVRTGFERPMQGFGTAALPALRRALHDRDPYLRAEAAWFLSWQEAAGDRRLVELRHALTRERASWPRYQLQNVVTRLQNEARQVK